MKIALFGATGHTGRLVLDHLLEQGHIITALVRTPANLDIQHPDLRIVKGNALVVDDVMNSIRGQDAVISVIGARTLKNDPPICSVSARNITNAMTQLGVKRLVFLSGVAMGEKPGILMTILRLLLLKEVYADAVAADAIVQPTDLDWTIVRPYRMTNGPQTQKYRISLQPFRAPILLRLTSRGDVVDFMARATLEGTYLRQTAYLSTHGI